MFESQHLQTFLQCLVLLCSVRYCYITTSLFIYIFFKVNLKFLNHRNEPSRHEELIQKLQKNIKVTSKNLQNVLLELAQYEVDKIKSTVPKPKYVIMFKKEATPEFNRAIIKGLEREGLFMFFASEEPDKPKEGQIIIQGPEEHCNALGNK